MQDAPVRMNKSATCSPTSAKSVQECSGSDLENTRRDLIALRLKHGADSPIWRRCAGSPQGVSRPVDGRPTAASGCSVSKLLAS